jgi:hypothetical protein
MTTSGTSTFILNRNEIVIAAFELLGLATEGRNITSYDMTIGVKSLNMMAKAWAAQGKYLWKSKFGYLFVVPNQASYTLDGVSSNVTENYVYTTLATNATSPTNSISITSASGMAVGYYIGIYLYNTTIEANEIFWTTISAISDTTITLTDNIPYDASSGTNVYSYQTNINFPIGVVSAERRYIGGTTQQSIDDIRMEIVAQNKYDLQVQKFNNSGNPVWLYYNKQIDYGIINLWPTPSDSSIAIRFTYEEMFYDAGIATNTLDFPVEWTETIIYNLAWRLAVIYGIGKERKDDIKTIADQMFTDLEGYDRERYTSIQFEPNFY